MRNKKLFLWAIIDSLAAFAYIVGVALLMFNGNKLFGETATFWMPVAILLLFVLSAVVVGGLVLGRPIYLYFSGEKKDGIKLLAYTICWLAIFTLIVFSAHAIMK